MLFDFRYFDFNLFVASEFFSSQPELQYNHLFIGYRMLESFYFSVQLLLQGRIVVLGTLFVSTLLQCPFLV